MARYDRVQLYRRHKYWRHKLDRVGKPDTPWLRVVIFKCKIQPFLLDESKNKPAHDDQIYNTIFFIEILVSRTRWKKKTPLLPWPIFQWRPREVDEWVPFRKPAGQGYTGARHRRWSSHNYEWASSKTWCCGQTSTWPVTGSTTDGGGRTNQGGQPRCTKQEWRIGWCPKLTCSKSLGC